MKLVFLYSTCALLQGCPNCTQESLFYRENRVKSSSSYTLQVFFGGVVSCSPRIYIFKISPFLFLTVPPANLGRIQGKPSDVNAKKKWGSSSAPQNSLGDAFSIWCIWCHLMIQHDSDGLFVSPSPEKKSSRPASPRCFCHCLCKASNVAPCNSRATAGCYTGTWSQRLHLRGGNKCLRATGQNGGWLFGTALARSLRSAPMSRVALVEKGRKSDAFSRNRLAIDTIALVDC